MTNEIQETAAEQVKPTINVIYAANETRLEALDGAVLARFPRNHDALAYRMADGFVATGGVICQFLDPAMRGDLQ